MTIVDKKNIYIYSMTIVPPKVLAQAHNKRSDIRPEATAVRRSIGLSVKFA